MLGAMGRLAERRNDIDEAESSYQQSLELGEHIGLERVVGSALNSLGNIALSREDYEAANRYNPHATSIKKSGVKSE